MLGAQPPPGEGGDEIVASLTDRPADRHGGLDSPALRTARRVADALLYEGYVLFPYRTAGTRGRHRWQWGVVAPQAHRAAGADEADETAPVVCQVLLRGVSGARVAVTARFQQLCRRQVRDEDGRPVDEVEIGGRMLKTWDEGLAHEVGTGPVALPALGDRPRTVPIDLPGTERVERVTAGGDGPQAQVARSTRAVTGRLTVSAESLGAGVSRLTATVDNRTDWADPDGGREAMLCRALLSVHLLVGADGARFVSLVDPPAWARDRARRCHNRGTNPVLVGRDDRAVLSAPIVLDDHPEAAPGSPGPSHDSIPIDELLSLLAGGRS